MRGLKIGLVASSLLASAACDYTGDWLFAGEVEGVPGVVDLGEIVPAVVTSPSTIDANAHYGEVGPTGDVSKGGVTFTFRGTGSNVCLWVDPEAVFWNQAVASRRPDSKYSYPDNVFDDGDIDLYAGLSAYYSGSPGETIGNFEVRYEDSLGNPVEIALNECRIESLNALSGGHAGRGAPEWCDIAATQPGVNYTVVLETWSPPLDDDRLGYGFLVVDGTCRDLQAASQASDPECLILGETIDINAGGDERFWTGLDSVPSRGSSTAFEEAFCSASTDMSEFCLQEASQKDCSDADEKCYCGDLANTPDGGSF